MAQRAGKTHECEKCGALVTKAISKAGKTYTANVIVWRGDLNGSKEILSGHTCDANEVISYGKLTNSNLKNGLLIKGQEVIAVKGRKVAKGTTGIIFWVEIDNGFAYGDNKVTRVGFKDAEGNAHFTAATNVIATNQLEKEGN
jgi:hypothetical protein